MKAIKINVIAVLRGKNFVEEAEKLVHNCTIFLLPLDVRNIDDQCRGPSIREKDHLVG